MSRPIYKIQVLRVKKALDDYIRTHIIDSNIDLNDLREFENDYPGELNDEQSLALRELLSALVLVDQNLIKKEYIKVLSQFHTTRHEFYIPMIMEQYRPNINPIKAIFYELNILMKSMPILAAITSLAKSMGVPLLFFSRVELALVHDIKLLENFIDSYAAHEIKNPIEIIHARCTLKEFSQFHNQLRVAETSIS